MKTNAELEDDVLDELNWDPSINADKVEVSADEGTIKLSGSIGSYSEMHQAERDARRVWGVVAIVNDLDVRLPPASQRTDADLAGAARDALEWNALVPPGIGVTADHGRLTLTGEADYNYQRQAAYDAVRWLIGITSINNQIRITPHVSAPDVKSKIERALVRNAEIDARNITVATSHGNVTLTGTVRSLAERDQAGWSAWGAPGVHDVHNELTVAG
jgi:osmotically-inducible protein OsmY